MSDERKADPTGAPREGSSEADGGETSSGLPGPLREHIGQQLRTTYHALEEKPAFLGETTVPPHLDDHIRRLEVSVKRREQEKVHDRGIEAVKSALGDLGLAPPDDEDRSENAAQPDES